MSVFKAYDIRGIYGEELTDDFAYRLGYFLPELLDVRAILVGRDIRTSSQALFEAFARGCMDSGCDVCDMGLCSTPMVYFGTCVKRFPASVMITASHNDPEYNGFKVSAEHAVPIGVDNGFADLAQMMQNNEIIVSKRKGIYRTINLQEEYIAFLREKLQIKEGLTAAFDCSNGMTTLNAQKLFGGKHTYLFDVLDGSFPGHSPNPLKAENCVPLAEKMQSGSYDFGAVFDGDGDRAVFLDEQGEVVPSDLMIALLAKTLAKKGDTVLYDIRTSRAVPEFLETIGAKGYMWKVGHFFAKRKMRELDAVVGGELAGHYYFRDFFYCDSALLAAGYVYNAVQELKKQGQTLSSFIKSIRKYESTGEMNYKVENPSAIIQRVAYAFTKEKRPDAVYDFDGVRIEYPDFWLNLRASNTEPYLRMVAEANDVTLLKKIVGKIENLINS